MIIVREGSFDRETFNEKDCNDTNFEVETLLAIDNKVGMLPGKDLTERLDIFISLMLEELQTKGASPKAKHAKKVRI